MTTLTRTFSLPPPRFSPRSFSRSERLFAVEEYLRMVELGILGENDKIELLDGRIVENSDLKPVLDDAKCRSFESTAEYRQWCEENLPDWLGYGRV